MLAATPLGALWFREISGLSDELTMLSASALLFALCMPGYAVAQNYHQGLLVHDKRTRPIVVRSVAGSCLTVNFTNLLDPDLSTILCSNSTSPHSPHRN